MSDFSAFLYDGQTSERRPVTVKLTVPGYLILQGFDTVSRFPADQIEVLPRLGEQPAVIELPDGARVEVAATEDFHAAWSEHGGQRQWAHRLESSWPTVLVVLLLTVGFGWLVYDRGIPGVSRLIAEQLPTSVDQEIGREGLAALDTHVFGPTTLPEAQQSELYDLMQDVLETVGGDLQYRLELRDGKSLGANAFALPAGIVIVTDQLVALADAPAEIAAIMAHEVGHVRNRHSLRTLLQNSLFTGLLVVLTGDVAVAGSIAAGLPTLLVSASYSREFEREADAVAREYLLASGESLCVYANIMRRLEEESADSSGSISLLRTHPSTDERLESFCP